MKRITLLVGTAVLAASAAQAMPAFAFDWTGAYVGATAGLGTGAFTTSDIEFLGVPTGIPTFTTSASGALLGLTGGYNKQMGQFVLGAEGDVSFSTVHGTDSTFAPSFTSEADLLNIGTLRGRAGFAMDGLMVFATGGLAAGNVRATLHDNYGTIVTTTDTKLMVGVTGGGGVEAAVTDNVTIKAEYLYYNLGTAAMSVSEPSPPGWSQITFNVAGTGTIARVGVNVHF